MTDTPPLSFLPPDPGDLPERADVIVLGASLAGLHLSRRLAEAGVDVLCLEARKDPARGVEGRDPGVLTGGLPEHPWRLVAAIGAEKAGILYGLSDRGIRLAAPAGGEAACHAAIDAREVEELRKSAAALEALGKQVTWLDADAACEALNGEGFTAAIRVMGELATDVEAVVRRVLVEAIEAGVTVRTGQRVTGLGHVDADACVRLGSRTVRADAIVLAGDHRLTSVAPWLGDKLIPVREHALRLPAERRRPPARAQYGYVTWATDGDLGVRISGCRWATQHMEVYESQELPKAAVTDKIAGFAARHLGLQGVTPTHTWARILTATCDGLPILGPLPGDPTTVCCLGFQGFAPVLALSCAEDVATGLLTGASPLPDWLAPQRFL